KIELELAAYEELKKLPVRIPALLGSDRTAGYLIKEYIEGETASERLALGGVDEASIAVLLSWSAALRSAGLNIDYFPSNFVFGRGELYYIDYEINPYSEEWSFEEWGIYYWLNPSGFAIFLSTGDPAAINLSGTGRPVWTAAAEERRIRLLSERDRRALSEGGA
ncbi:MAG: hypothetical protein Q8M76_11660, partial [Spirochaetaceae bacterium]|nr:hypothetical protein [Spirochaetaceae bacterium]